MHGLDEDSIYQSDGDMGGYGSDIIVTYSIQYDVVCCGLIGCPFFLHISDWLQVCFPCLFFGLFIFLLFLCDEVYIIV